MAKHTNGKLETFFQDGKMYLEIDAPSGKVRLAEMTMAHRTDSVADADEFVCRWNSHDALLEACQDLVKTVPIEVLAHGAKSGSDNCAIMFYALRKGRAAIALAEEKKE